MFQQGQVALVEGVQSVSVAFPDPTLFSVVPELLYSWVDNTSADATILLIKPTLVTKTLTGFQVDLDIAPPTGNYTLSYFAGIPQFIFSVFSAGIRVSALPICTNPVSGYIPFVNTVGVPTTEKLPWSTIVASFALYVPTPPASPTSRGAVGQWSVDATRLYTHDGTLWGISTRNTTWS
jgi:hypothetical protein